MDAPERPARLRPNCATKSKRKRCALGRNHFATDWQEHTIRGFIPTLASKRGFVVRQYAPRGRQGARVRDQEVSRTSIGVREEPGAWPTVLVVGRRRSAGSAVTADLVSPEPPHSLILRPARRAQHPVCRPRPPAPVVAGCPAGVVG